MVRGLSGPPLVARSRAHDTRHLALPLPLHHQRLMKTGPALAVPEEAPRVYAGNPAYATP